MKISSKLMIIVILTIFEISITIYSVFEISKGSKFHHLNALHLKYTGQLSEEILSLSNNSTIDINKLTVLLGKIREQPVNCLKSVNFLNKFVMSQIGTYEAVELCIKDIEDVDDGYSIISQFENNIIDKNRFISELKGLAQTFKITSALFEKPITETVSFIMKTMVPVVLIISFFNILFITYMSRTISNSIRCTIKLLKSNRDDNSLDDVIKTNVSGELKTLLDVAKERLANQLLITEVNDKLEKLVEQRTESLTRANDELAQFAYRTSHDLKAPLSSSKLLTRFIIQDIEAGDIDNAVKDVHQIHEQMEKLENLVMNLLSLTEADTAEDSDIMLNIDEILDDIEQNLSGVCESSNYQLIRDIRCNIMSDKVRITQVLENLISNALKYRDETKESSPFVKIIVDESSQYYQLIISDNGIGIPKERHEETFQMFKRFHPNVSFGSGLGLSIVKKHIDYIKGTITMKSSTDGTVFSITIPKV